LVDELTKNSCINTAEIAKLHLQSEALILRAYSHLKIMALPDLKSDAALAGVLADRIILSRACSTKSYKWCFMFAIQKILMTFSYFQ
jgi:hypothetical protein